MTDNLQDRGAQDRRRVNLNQEHEVRYWTEEFGCTEEHLSEAVSRVGSLADRVREAVRGQR